MFPQRNIFNLTLVDQSSRSSENGFLRGKLVELLEFINLRVINLT